jgi:hypothetical protein
MRKKAGPPPDIVRAHYVSLMERAAQPISRRHQGIINTKEKGFLPSFNERKRL